MKGAGNLKTKSFTLIVATVGSLAVMYSIYRLWWEPVRLDWILVLTLTMLLSLRAEVWIPGVRSKITLSDMFVCIAMLMLAKSARRQTPVEASRK